jgi:hypothetical protein
MKIVILLGAVACCSATFAQQSTTGGPGQIVTSADIFCDINVTTALTPPYVLYKDRAYTAVFGYYDVGGCDPYDPNGRIITSFDGVVIDSTRMPDYADYDLPIKHTSMDTGHHVISFSVDAFQYSNVIYHRVYNFMVYICGTASTITAPPLPATTPPIIATPKTLCLYPNPARDSVFIAPLDSSETHWLLDISDSRGNIVSHFQGNDNHVAIPTSTLLPGLYYTELRTNKRSYKTKFEVAER